MPELRNAKWVFFDVGYTLVDETSAWDDRFIRLASEVRRRGRDVSIDEIWTAYREVCTDFEPKQWRGTVEAFARTESEADELSKLIEGYRHDLELPYPGATNVLKTIAETKKIGVVANQAAGTRDRLWQRGWGEFISLVVCSTASGIAKPDPAIYQLALKQAKCKPADAVMVGDRLDNDIAPAKALGMMTVHVRQGGSGLQQPRDESEAPDATVASIGDVAGLFV